MPRTSAPAVLDELEAMASPPTTGVAAPPPTRASVARVTVSFSSQSPKPPGRVTSTTMCALLPRILRFRSWPKPPMIEVTEQSAHELTLTPGDGEHADGGEEAALGGADVARAHERDERAALQGAEEQRQDGREDA